jgi:hypothetical protein
LQIFFSKHTFPSATSIRPLENERKSFMAGITDMIETIGMVNDSGGLLAVQLSRPISELLYREFRSAPKGRSMVAQGIALGKRTESSTAP